MPTPDEDEVTGYDIIRAIANDTNVDPQVRLNAALELINR